MNFRNSVFYGFCLLLFALIIQTTSQRNPVAFADGSYPYLGKVVPISVPNCSANSSTTVASTIQQINLALENPNIKVICLNPGTYAQIDLAYPGTAQSPRYLIPNHGAGQSLAKPWTQPQNQRVKVNNIIFNSAYWRVIGLNVVSDDGLIVEFREDSNNNVLDNVLVEGISESLPAAAGNRSMTRIREEAFYNHIQNSVLRNPPRVPGSDSHCMVIRDTQHNTIINNQIYDCPGDGIQIATFPTTGWDNRGNKIINNEIYITNQLYAVCTDESPNANLNGPGECACAENAIDIKYIVNTPVSNQEDKFVISGNQMYGFQESHPTCGGSGDKTAPAIYLQNKGTQDILIEGNVIAESDTGIQLKDTGDGGPDNLSVFNNMLYNIKKNRALHIAGGINNQFTHNTIVLTLNDGGLTGRNSVSITSEATSGILSNNLFISAYTNYRGYTNLSDLSGFIVKNNGYVGYATQIPELPGMGDLLLPNEPLSHFSQHCFSSQKHTAGVTKCYSYLEAGPNAATMDTINTSQFGLDYDFYDRERILPYDMGATEVPLFDFFAFMPGMVKKN